MAELDSKEYRYEDPFILQSEKMFLYRFHQNSEREHLESSERMGTVPVTRTPINEMNADAFEIFLAEVKNTYPLFRERFPVAGEAHEFVSPINEGGFSTIYLGVRSLREYGAKGYGRAIQKHQKFLETTNKKTIAEIFADLKTLKAKDQKKLRLVQLLSALPIEEKYVAAKVLDSDYEAGSSTHRRFEDEIKILNKLDHPNIVHIIEAPREHTCENFESLFLYIMEYLPTGFDEGEAYSVSTVLSVVHSVAKALDAMHKQGIVHRDIKPPNIRATSDGIIKLTDFGIIKKTELYKTKGERSITPKTESGHIIGSLGFMSPEQAKGHSVDHRTDIYSLGTTMWNLLTGEMPFNYQSDADTVDRMIQTIVSERQRTLAEFEDQFFVDEEEKIKPSKVLKKALKQIHRKSTERDPENRYSSTELFIEDLEMALTELQKG